MGACPRPEKVRYPDKAAAKQAIRELYAKGRGNPDLMAYPCVCGAWHVGHNLTRFKQRIRRSLRNPRPVRRKGK
jgi:hypothetical protein